MSKQKTKVRVLLDVTWKSTDYCKLNHTTITFYSITQAYVHPGYKRLKYAYKIMNWGHHQVKFWSAICQNASLKHMASDYILDE